MKFYNFPASESGLIDIVGKKIDANNQISPDSSCTFTRTGSAQALSLQGAPRAIVYVKHEKVVQPDGTSIGVKRASRISLAQAILNGATVATATVDSAIGTGGTMARLSGAVSCSDIQPAIFDLVFDGVSYLQFNAPSSGGNPLAIKGPYSISFLLAPAAARDGVSIFAGADGSGSTLRPNCRWRQA